MAVPSAYQRPEDRRLILPAIGSLTTACLVAVGGPTIGLLALAGALLAALTAFLPGALFAIYLLSGTYKAAVQPFSPIDITLVLAACNAMQIVPVALGRRSMGLWRTGLALLVGVGLVYLAGVLYAPDPNVALRDAATFWAFTVIAMVPAAIRVTSDSRYVRQFLWTLFALGIPMTVAGLGALSSSARLQVFDASTIEVSRAALLVPLVGVTFVLHRAGLLVRAVTAVIVPASIIVAVASGSRGPLIALLVLAAAGGLHAIIRPGRTQWRAIVAVALVAIVSVVVLSLAGQALPGLSTSRFGLLEDFVRRFLDGGLGVSVGDTSAERRLALFDVAIRMFQERPLLGFGTGAFAAISPTLLGPPYEAWPHNAILQFAAEFGVVGVALFAIVVAAALGRRVPGPELGHAVRAALAFFLLNAMFSDDVYGSRPTWGLLTLALLAAAPGPSTALATARVKGLAEQARVLPAPGAAT